MPAKTVRYAQTEPMSRRTRAAMTAVLPEQCGPIRAMTADITSLFPVNWVSKGAFTASTMLWGHSSKAKLLLFCSARAAPECAANAMRHFSVQNHFGDFLGTPRAIRFEKKRIIKIWYEATCS
jgi:hypothetical protein